MEELCVVYRHPAAPQSKSLENDATGRSPGEESDARFRGDAGYHCLARWAFRASACSSYEAKPALCMALSTVLVQSQLA